MDTVSYAGASAGVTANLGLGIGAGGDAEGDTYVSIEAATGSSHGDTLVGDHATANTLSGRDGDDVIYGTGLDTVNGGSGNDVFFGGSGGSLNLDLATASIETVWGSVVDDVINGDTASGNLVMIGAGGADTMIGGSGNDFLYFDHLDTIAGGAGADWAVATLSMSGVNLDMSAASIENAWGSVGDDIFNGSAANTTIVAVGDVGNDTLLGGSAGDFLYGFGGNDRLSGGAGNDNLVGGIGNDTFAYNSMNWGVDLIWDFAKGLDKIDMAGSGFSDYQSLTITPNGAHSVIQSGSNAIWVLDVAGLAESDFDFM
jgi:Ca2+-binding RTX toxin-like protein